MIITLFRKAGEPTETIPPYLCQQARERLKIWQRLPVRQMREELRQDIEQLNRFEILEVDPFGLVLAMMVIDSDYNPHYGSYLYPRYSFSTENGLLSKGYQWLKQISKALNYDGFLITRQIDDFNFIHKFKRLPNK
ncbi:hypothetical protein GEM21_05425 [Salmonella enterica]|nr:hypothetical protein [Salmonella enterica]EEO2148453.1 hypothetical protein [Salmonella enterica]EIL8912089.1 hypothetical protein [Salmonella enterica]